MAESGARGASGSDPDAADDVAGTVGVLQDATRLLAGVALRSVDERGGAVSLPQYRVLAVLADLGKVRSARVADALGLGASTVTRLVDRLAAAGHVLREDDPTNRSAVILQLTPAGRHLVTGVVAWRQAELERLLLLLTPAERRSLAIGLAQLVEVASEGYGTTTAPSLPF